MTAHQSRTAWQADREDGTYRNPVLFADYSDPDVIRVGEDFYMVSSSFSHLPGLPLLHSRDLVNWSLANHIVPKLELPGYDRPQHGKGIWAPSIRYHDGRFWVFFSTPDEGIFMCTADDPLGEWSVPHMVQEAKGWIDPCPFWDDDGKAYLVHAFAASRCGIKHKLRLFEMSPDGRALLGEGKIIYDGTLNHPTLEGPKVYKRNGYYYIFAPAGGVETGWQTILRSRSIWGDYEDKIVLHQGSTDVNGPHQGGWVELASGESWFVHFQDRGAYGRVVHLQPMDWEADWPRMGRPANDGGPGEPVPHHRKPGVADISPPIAVPATSDEFDGARLGLQWQWQANPQPEWYSLEARPHHIRLYAHAPSGGETVLYHAPNLLMQKFPAPVFSAGAKLTLHAESPEERAGLIVFGETYYSLAIQRAGEGEFRLGLTVGELDSDGAGRSERELAPSLTLGSAEIYLRVDVSADGRCAFSCSLNGSDYTPIGPACPATAGKWVGAKAGIFASGRGDRDRLGYADFDWFRIEGPEADHEGEGFSFGENA